MNHHNVRVLTAVFVTSPFLGMKWVHEMGALAVLSAGGDSAKWGQAPKN